ncbi:gp29 [Streptococcus suis]|uniref:Gp29 n=2 Tax=Streptococcus suis TaxID=1307 RepID=A0A0Z8VL63_STRSU|nr:gp29 [Streptococcus suis]
MGNYKFSADLESWKLLGNKMETEIYDNVTKPKHYQGKYGMEALEVVKNFIWDLAGERAYYWGNVIKYLLRFQQKNGVEDLKKARQNLDWLIEDMEEVE